MLNLRTIRKFRASLGPVEQAQIVASTAVVVAMVTIVLVRVFSDYKLGWYDFVSVTTVGIFGYLIVYFTLKYGRLLEEQKQELLALNAIAEAVNRPVDITFLLDNALQEVRRLLDAEYGWMYHLEGGKLILNAQRGTEKLSTYIISPDQVVDDSHVQWIYMPRIERKANKKKRTADHWPSGEIGAWASVPLMIKERFAGVLIVASTDRDAFTKKQLDLMSALVNQIGVALENAELFERLRKSEERYMDLFEHSPDMYHIVNRSGIIVSCNQTEADRLGYRKDEIVGFSILRLYPTAYHGEARKLLDDIFTHKQEISGLEEQMLTKKGELIDVNVNTSVIYDETGEPVLMRAVARDITEKKKLEAKILHAQRIDSIGNLAGGVAHDFNNILTSILGSTSIMKRKMRKSLQWYRFVDIIEMAAKRGAGLTRQLLTFARKGNVQFRPIVVNDIIEETLHLFERSVDKTITVRKILPAEVCLINGDDGQIQQALLNLLINARDAMSDGGSITVQCDCTNGEARNNGDTKDAEDAFVTITITDTGVGMDRKTQQHIFEPFFTTKDQGQGTGLGLSVVYGVVNSHNGFITVQSEPGIGSRFTLHFPLLQDTKLRRHSSKHARLLRGTEEILVVDDEEHVGEVIGGMLGDLGYKVTVVKSGREALTLFRKKKKRFDGVVLDMNMPRMGGKEMFFKLKELAPEVRIIISTGYSNTGLESSPLAVEVDGILQKPYQLEELSKAMRNAFDRQRV